MPLAESPDSSSSSDAGLVLRCRDGDTDAFARLAERHSAAIYGVALAIVRDRGEAEDVTQETLLSAWRKLDSLQEPAAVRTWMFRIAHHRSLEVLRRRGSRATDAVAELPELAEHAVGLGRSSTYGQPERAIEAADAVSTLKAALEALPETQRVVWTLAEIDELSYHEIATVTGASVTTVRGRLARARLNLSEAVTTPR